MSKNTERKALKLVKELKGCIENSCYFVAEKHLKKLNKMIERHLKKELK